MPATPMVTLRFPDGDVEHRSREGELPVGALIRARGTLWRVHSFDGEAVILEAAEEPVDGASAGPLIDLDALGDTPLTLEALVEA